MVVTVFLLCFNESVLLPHTIKHYKTQFPSCRIIIYDNESTDDSVEKATLLGCEIVSWNSDNIIDDYKYSEIKNNCWKDLEEGWMIVADMDEYLCITEKELLKEESKGTTILTIQGYEMIGESETLDLSDIDLFEISKRFPNTMESKNLCFHSEHILEMNYNNGAHKCKPVGNVQYSKKKYINKHMCYLGLPYIIDKMQKRFDRSAKMRSNNLATHYTNNVEEITERYNKLLRHSQSV